MSSSAAEQRRTRELALMAEANAVRAAWEQSPEQVAGAWGRTFAAQAEPHMVEQVIAALDELGRFSRASVTVERYVAEETGELIARAAMQVLEERHPPQQVSESKLVEFQSPRTWVDHFKWTYRSRWWARWWVARRPVEYRVEQRVVEVVVELDRARLFPKADIRPPTSYGPPVEWWRWKSLAREVR